MDIETTYKLLDIAINASIEAGKAIMKVYSYKDFSVTLKSDKSPLTLADRNAHHIIDAALQQTGYPVLSEEGKNIPYGERKNWEYFWLVDPLDGTKEFIKRNGEFTVNIALIHENKPLMGVIFVPAINKLYFGSVGIGSFIHNYKGADESFHEIQKKAQKLPLNINKDNFTVIASRSHVNQRTIMIIHELKKINKNIETISKGSSIKLCLIAEGTADVYPRYNPTMEWDTAAGHAILISAGGKIARDNAGNPLEYNKVDLLNPSFIAYCSAVSLSQLGQKVF